MNHNEDVFKIWGTTEKEYLAKSMDKVHLEMEISTYLKDWEDDEEIGLHLSTDNGCIPIELEDVRDLARHFAQWQKEQMMKEAVEGEVRKDGTIGYFEFSNEQQFHSLLEQFQDCDKVRIIIIKD